MTTSGDTRRSKNSKMILLWRYTRINEWRLVTELYHDVQKVYLSIYPDIKFLYTHTSSLITTSGIQHSYSFPHPPLYVLYLQSSAIHRCHGNSTDAQTITIINIGNKFTWLGVCVLVPIRVRLYSKANEVEKISEDTNKKNMRNRATKRI